VFLQFREAMDLHITMGLDVTQANRSYLSITALSVSSTQTMMRRFMTFISGGSRESDRQNRRSRSQSNIFYIKHDHFYIFAMVFSKTTVFLTLCKLMFSINVLQTSGIINEFAELDTLNRHISDRHECPAVKTARL
jgi:hypothetical protein